MSRSLIRLALYWLPVALWMLVIFSASADQNSFQHSSRIMGPIIRFFWPNLSGTEFFHALIIGRKIAHVGVYAVLAVLLWFAFNGTFELRPRIWNWKPVRWTLGVIVLYATIDEIHQIYVPTRQGSPWDVLIDTTGAALALFLIWLMIGLRNRLRKPVSPLGSEA